MRLGLASLALLVLPLACSFDSSGQPEAGSGGDEVDVTTGMNESGGESGTDQGSSSSADTGTSDSTSDSTTDPTSESTTDPTTDSTSESTTDPTTDSTTDTTTTDTTTTDTTTDTGMEGDPYGMCGACLPSEGCIDEFAITPDWEVCYTSCNDNSDCPAAAGGEPVSCVFYDFDGRCFIDCSNVPCPRGMSCKAVNLGNDKVCAFDK